MEYIFFYLSIIAILIIFFICNAIRRMTLPSFIIGLTSVGYSLISDLLFGDQLKLFYYIGEKISILYMMLSALFIYSILNIIYTMFLPRNEKKVLIYTVCWIVALCIFEYASIITKTIVFTGWKPIPWSLVTYIAAYLWIYFFYRLLSKRYLQNWC